MKTATRNIAVTAAIVSGAAFAGLSGSPAMAADGGYGGYGAPGSASAPAQPFGGQPFNGQPFVGGSNRFLSCGFVRSTPTLETVVLSRLLHGRHGHRFHHRHG